MQYMGELICWAVIEHHCDEDGRYDRICSGFSTRDEAYEYAHGLDCPYTICAMVH